MVPHLRARLVAALAAERRRGYEGLAGSNVQVVLPLRQAVVNQITSTARWPRPIETLAVRIAAANVLAVAAQVRVFGFVTPLGVRVRVSPAIEDGILRLEIDDASFVGRAVSWLGPLLARMPVGVRLRGARIEVDMRQVAADHGLADIASMVIPESCTTSDGVVWFTVRVQPPTTVPFANGPSRPPSPPPIDPDQLVAWLEGARVHGEIRIDERLANELVAVAHAGLRDATLDNPVQAALVGAFTESPSVRFEAGALVVSVAGEVGAHEDGSPVRLADAGAPSSPVPPPDSAPRDTGDEEQA